MSTTANTDPNPPRTGTAKYASQTLGNRMLLVVLAMVVLVPIFAVPTNVKLTAFAIALQRVMAGLLAGLLVFRARFARDPKEIAVFLGTGANLPILLYVAYSAFSFFLAPTIIRPVAGIELMRIVTGALLYFAIAYHVHRSEHLTKIIDALVLTSGMMALAGMLSMVAAGNQAGIMSYAMGDHQIYGGFMMILFPIPVIAALTDKDPQRQLFAQISAALTAIALLMSGTRSAWVGVFVEILALCVFSFIGYRNQHKDAGTNKAFLVPVLIAVSCVGIFLVLARGEVASILFHRSNTAEALIYRQRMWFGAGELIKQSPLVGHGLGAYPVLQEQYTGYGRTGDKVLATNASIGEMAHSFWLQTAAEQGILGACLFAAVIILFIVSAARRLFYLDPGVRRSLLLATTASIAGFAVDALANPAWQFSQASMYVWLMLGLGVASLRPRKS